MANKVEDLIVENAEILFRNFSGKEGKFNPAGRRNFCVLLEDKVAKGLEKDGWNIKWLNPREEGDEPRAFLQVQVSFSNYPPKIILISSKGKSYLGDNEINILDWAEIEHIDMVIRPYSWEVRGQKGIKAYLKNMYVKIVEDPFADKYDNAPDSAVDSIGGCGNCDICDGGCNEI